MYRNIVRRKVTAIFDAVSHGDAGPVLDGFADTFEHGFLGDHALGGSRKTLAATHEWYARLYRLLPDIAFTLHEIEVHGPPWDTQVAVSWTETNSGADGVRTSARGVHLAGLRWGQVTKLMILPDTKVLCATLERLAAAGFEEAAAEPIVD